MNTWLRDLGEGSEKPAVKTITQKTRKTENTNTVLKEWETGEHNTSKIAAKLSVTNGYVRQVLVRAGLLEYDPNGMRNTVLANSVLAAHEKGYSPKEIALRLGKPTTNVRRVLRRHGKIQPEQKFCKKRVKVYNYKTGEFVREYESLIAASRDLGIRYENIWKILVGQNKQSKGYTFVKIGG